MREKKTEAESLPGTGALPGTGDTSIREGRKGTVGSFSHKNSEIDGGRPKNDSSSEERFIWRSKKIQRATKEFLESNLGVLFEDLEEASSQAANYAGKKWFRGEPCSTITAQRWIRQLTAKNGPFIALNSNAGVVFYARSDIAKWL